MTSSDTLLKLVAQHDELRDLMDRCEDLLDTFEAVYDGDPSALVREIARLRLAFDAHNKFEENVLRPVLLEHDVHGVARIERMVADHVDEHRLIRRRLEGSATAALRDVIETLRAHLDAEERYLLVSSVMQLVH